MQLPRYVEFVLDTLNQKGFEAYVVGGCVRDYLMGGQPSDYDIATSATPDEIKTLFRKTFDTGIKHGTITVTVNGGIIEVTTYRVDGEYRDNRHPDNVMFTNDLKQDLLRRDFTMNAIAYNPLVGYVDICEGRKDIVNGVIRGVGQPGLRFREDALRMLRAIRFAGQLGFEIEPETYAAIVDNANLIRNISAERIRDELVKLLLSESPHRIRLINQSGLMKHIDDGLYDYFADNFDRLLPALMLCRRETGLRLAVLLQYMEQSRIQGLMTKLKFDNKRIKEVMIYVKWMQTDIACDSYRIRVALSIVGVEAFDNIIYLKTLNPSNAKEDTGLLEGIKHKFRQIVSDKDCLSMSQLKINGDDLFSIGFTKGKVLGETLSCLFDVVLKNPLMNDECLLKTKAAQIYAERFRE